MPKHWWASLWRKRLLLQKNNPFHIPLILYHYGIRYIIRHWSLILHEIAGSKTSHNSKTPFLGKKKQILNFQTDKISLLCMITPNQEKASFVNIWEGLQNLLMQLLGSKAFTGEKIFSLPRVVPCFPLLGLTPSGLFMGLSSTIIYTSELILWFH